MQLRLAQIVFVLVFQAVGFPALAAEGQRIDRRIDLQKTLFGIEYSFQDKKMTREPGRRTITTEHKAKKMGEFLEHYLKRLGLGEEVLREKPRPKPGWFIDVPDDGVYTVNQEPVTIEVNSSAKRLTEIRPVATKIMAAARDAKLVPYVNPAAERSGMGHIHVGGRSFFESPFYKHPLLLRNMLVYFHKHPALLYGFAEAFDYGIGSNIETYHPADRQRRFQTAIEKFDRWYKNRNPNQVSHDAVVMRLLRLIEKANFSAEYNKYRYINIVRLYALKKRFWQRQLTLPESGHHTVEFRAFRPPKNAKTAEAYCRLLIAVMEKLSQPGYLEPFRYIEPPEVRNFYSAAKIQTDWQQLRAELQLKIPELDRSVAELVGIVLRKPQVTLGAQAGAELKVYRALSEKEQKSRWLELHVTETRAKKAQNVEPVMPVVEINGKKLALELLDSGGKRVWLAVFEPEAEFAVSVNRILKNPKKYIRWQSAVQVASMADCEKLLNQ